MAAFQQLTWLLPSRLCRKVDVERDSLSELPSSSQVQRNTLPKPSKITLQGFSSGFQFIWRWGLQNQLSWTAVATVRRNNCNHMAFCRKHGELEKHFPDWSCKTRKSSCNDDLMMTLDEEWFGWGINRFWREMFSHPCNLHSNTSFPLALSEGSSSSV